MEPDFYGTLSLEVDVLGFESGVQGGPLLVPGTEVEPRTRRTPRSEGNWLKGTRRGPKHCPPVQEAEKVPVYLLTDW